MAVNKYCTNNDCYKENRKLASVSWLIVHSPAVYPTIIRVLSGAGGGWFRRWNKPGVEKLVHGFIDDTGVYNFAPDTMACWQIGNAWGNANCIGYELCELESRAEFEKMWNHAAAHYAALCRRHGLTAERVIGHYEAHDKGFASNHDDPAPYFRRFGKTMADFRADVKKCLSGADTGAGSGTVAVPAVIKRYNPPAYARVGHLAAGDTLNVRTAPDASASRLAAWPELAAGNEVDVLELYSNGWAKVNIQGNKGYVNASYLQIAEESAAGSTSGPAAGGPGAKADTATIIGCTALNVRATPNGKVVTTIKGGSTVEVIGSGKDSDGDTWYKIRQGAMTGYVWPKYLALS